MLTLINGNGKEYQRPLPKIELLTRAELSVEFLAHLEAYTGLAFKRDTFDTYAATPPDAESIVKLVIFGGFKYNYYDNATFQNVIKIKFTDDQTIFNLNSICGDCATRAGIKLDEYFGANDRLGV